MTQDELNALFDGEWEGPEIPLAAICESWKDVALYLEARGQIVLSAFTSWAPEPISRNALRSGSVHDFEQSDTNCMVVHVLAPSEKGSSNLGEELNFEVCLHKQPVN
jgi:hypothetical protein